jgi:purine catabolism regulator
MALTPRALAAELGLPVLAGDAALDRPIGWVHPTELADPVPFLEGGELLLTTGLTLDDDSAPGYVRRLAAVGVTGIGFGVGLSHEVVPGALVRAAAAAGLPLLEVPRPTPFIAITRTVSRAVAADEYAAVVRTGRGQQELTRAAVGRRGPGAVIRTLARLVGAAVLLLDGNGEPREAAPAAARTHAGDLRGELERMRSGTRLAGSRRRIGAHEVVLQALDTRARAYLAVLTEEPMDAASQHIVTTAASLLSLALERNRAQGVALRRLRSGLFGLLVSGQAELAVPSMAALWGGVAPPPWTVFALGGGPAVRRSAFEVLDGEYRDAGEALFFAEHGSYVVAVASAEGAAAQRVESLATQLPWLSVGISDPVSTVDVQSGWRQAERAAEAARDQRVPVVRFGEYAGRGLLGLLPPAAATAFADTLLAPLRRHDESGRGELVDSLRCWLEHHGHWDSAAARLGVHRHTLRNRMRKVEELTGRGLDSPGVRSELWLALQVHGRP